MTAERLNLPLAIDRLIQRFPVEAANPSIPLYGMLWLQTIG